MEDAMVKDSSTGGENAHERPRKRHRGHNPTYISKADLRDKDDMTIVADALLRMTPQQFEQRCTHNKVHFVLTENDRLNPVWDQPSTITLLGKGPKFIPMAGTLDKMEVQNACAILKYQVVGAFERHMLQDWYDVQDAMRREAGIQPWSPKRPPLQAEFCQEHVKRFFKCSEVNGLWRGNQYLSPYFELRINEMEQNIITAAEIAKTTMNKTRWTNLSKEERNVITQVRKLDVGYNIADKNYGAVIYSKSLFKEQCLLHLEDGKGTYNKIEGRSRGDILEDVRLNLRNRLIRFKEKGAIWTEVVTSIVRDSEEAAKKGRLCKFYILWKLHKAANAAGLRSRPIAAAIGYITGPASHFLHCQLKEAVWKHPFVLKDSLDLIRILETWRFDADEQIMLTAADVNALYPSIRLQDGLAALRWFMDHHTDFNHTLKDLCMELAHFVLTNNYVECEELGSAVYHQIVGTAMGTTFSVIYAIIFMIWLESPIVNNPRFSQYIRLYKRFIDDLLLIWNGPTAILCEFRRAFARANENISLDWSGYESQEEAIDPLMVTSERHQRVNYLDLDLARSLRGTRKARTFQISIRPYRKPGNAYAYIPFNSFHGRHTFRGWVVAELLRLATHSSTPDTWLKETKVFYHHLRSRGYPSMFLEQVFKEVTWARRTEVLRRGDQNKDDFFKTYRACVLTIRNAPEWSKLRMLMDLSLRNLREETWGDIFPKKVFLAQSSAPRLGSILKR